MSFSSQTKFATECVVFTAIKFWVAALVLSSVPYLLLLSNRNFEFRFFSKYKYMPCIDTCECERVVAVVRLQKLWIEMQEGGFGVGQSSKKM